MSDLIWLHSLAGQRKIALRDVADFEVEDRLHDLSSITFAVQADDPRAAFLIPDTIIRWRDRQYRMIEHDQERPGYIVVVAEALWTDLARRVRFGNFPLLGLTAQAGLVKILQGTNWTAGADPDPGDTTLFSVEGYDDSALTHARRWASICGYEIEFDTIARSVTLVTQVGEDRGVGFRYGSNVRRIRRRYQPPRATVLYPVGANSLTVEAINPTGERYIEDYSWYTAQGLTLSQARNLHRKEEVWVDSSFLTALPLFDRGVERLATLAQPVVSYEADVVDVAAAVGTVVPFEVGDTVKVRDDRLNVDLTTRIVRRVYRPKAPGGDEIELAYLRPGGLDVDESEVRSPDYAAVSVLVDQADEVTVTGGAEDWGEIVYNSTGSASTAVMGSTFVGTATGSGTIRHTLLVDGVGVGQSVEQAFTTGQLVEFSAPSYAADLAEGAHTVVWRAQIVAGSGTVAIAADGARAWVLTTGAFGLGVDLSPNRRIAEELLDLVLEAMPHSFAVTLHEAVDVLTSEGVDELIYGEMTDSYTFPFTIGDPTFGAIEGPGTIPA